MEVWQAVRLCAIYATKKKFVHMCMCCDFFFNSWNGPHAHARYYCGGGKLRQEAVKCLSAGSQQLHLDGYLCSSVTALPSLTSGLNMSAKTSLCFSSRSAMAAHWELWVAPRPVQKLDGAFA